MSSKNRIKGSALTFISQINRDGSGTTPVEESYIKILKTEEFDLSCLSLTNKTYLALGFNSFVVKLKNFMQIIITEHNDHEGETFNYVLNDITPEELTMLRSVLADSLEYGEVEIEENTKITTEDIKKINKYSGNGYMDAIGFYEFPGKEEILKKYFDDLNVKDPELNTDEEGNGFYNNIIYKGIGFNRIKE